MTRGWIRGWVVARVLVLDLVLGHALVEHLRFAGWERPHRVLLAEVESPVGAWRVGIQRLVGTHLLGIPPRLVQPVIARVVIPCRVVPFPVGRARGRTACVRAARR